MIASRRASARGSLVVLLAVAGAWAAHAAGARAAQAPSPARELEIGERLSAAELRLRAGDAAGAEAEFRQIVAVAPRLAEARHGLARALAAQGETGEAVRLLLELAAGSAGSRAVDFAAEAVALAPAAAAAQLAYGRALVHEQRFDAALVPLGRAAELAPDDPTTHLMLGLASWESGELERARESLEQAVESSRRSRVAVHQLGRLHLWAGRPEVALPLLREAAAGGPAGEDVLVALGQALERTGELDPALAAYRRAVAAAPDSEAARYGLARLLLRLGASDAARAELTVYEHLRDARTAAQAEADRARARLDFGWSLLADGDDARAAATFAALPVSAESLAGLARARVRLGDATGAVTALERAVALAPDRQDLRALLAEARLAAGERP